MNYVVLGKNTFWMLVMCSFLLLLWITCPYVFYFSLVFIPFFSLCSQFLFGWPAELTVTSEASLKVYSFFLILWIPCSQWKQAVTLLLLLLSRFSRVQLFATPWTAAYQAPLSMGFSRQEYWSGVPLPSLAVTLNSSEKNWGLLASRTNLPAM